MAAVLGANDDSVSFFLRKLKATQATYEIDFADAKSARKALYEYDQRTLDGRKLSVTLGPANKRTPRSGNDQKKGRVFAAAMEDAVGDSKNAKQRYLAVDDKPKKVVVDIDSVLKKSPARKKTPRPERTAPKTRTRR